MFFTKKEKKKFLWANLHFPNSNSPLIVKVVINGNVMCYHASMKMYKSPSIDLFLFLLLPVAHDEWSPDMKAKTPE